MNGCANDRDIGSNEIWQRDASSSIIFLLHTFLLQFQRYLPNVTHVARNAYFSFTLQYTLQCYSSQNFLYNKYYNNFYRNILC